MTENNHGNRIPFEDIDSSTAWTFPSWDDGAKVVSSVKKKKPEQAKTDNERIEDVEGHSMQPITAQQLQQMTEEAEREGREHGYKEGYEQGFSEGEEKGRKLGEQKAYAEVKQSLDERSERFRQLIEALMDPVAMQDNGLENLVLDMAVHFAKHLINRELTEDPSSLFHVVQRAAASLPAGAQNIRIYLHADDVELAHEAFSGTGRDWTFYSDAQLTRGGCRVESNQSLIDYSIEKRLQQMLEEVTFQGEIEPESLPPVADYRPADDEHSPDAAENVSDEESLLKQPTAMPESTADVDDAGVDNDLSGEDVEPPPDEAGAPDE